MPWSAAPPCSEKPPSSSLSDAYIETQEELYSARGASRDDAIVRAIEDCIREDIFAAFVVEHGSEVENMLFTQFNMEDAKKVWYEEGESRKEYGKVSDRASRRECSRVSSKGYNRGSSM